MTTHSLETRRILKNMTHSLFGRCLSWMLVTSQVFLAVPMASAAVTEEKAKPEGPATPAPPSVKVNRTVPKVTPPPSRPSFSSSPTDEDIFRAHVFEEPLVPARATSPAENLALSRALLAYLDAGGGEAVEPLDRFLRAYPQTAWRAALLTDLGLVYRRTGYFTKALSAWDEAWSLGKGETEPRVRALAERAVSELAELYSRLGRTDTLEALLAELEGRDVRGSASERLVGAREGLWQMRNTPGKAFRCGPLSLERILASRLGREPDEAKLKDAQSTSQGTSLAQMEALAQSVGLGMRMARREDTAGAISLPAMVHWKAGHFAALVRSEGGRYLVQDPTFGGDLWVTRRALEEEASGYFLVPEGTLPADWRAVAEEEGSGVWGRGVFTSLNPNATTSSSPKAKPPSCPPMAVYNMHLLLASLNVTDTPLRYTPPRGPGVAFGVTYNQREAFQPQSFSYSNLGPKWTFDWLSYVEDTPGDLNTDMYVYARGGGREPHKYNAQTGSYDPHYHTMALVVRTSSNPIRYERRLPDGSVEVFSQPDSGSTPRKVFMTQSIDPQGNSLTFLYDASFRIAEVRDALQQPTTLSYELPPPDNLKITKVTDPFGRFARFDYNAAGQLQRITDVIGITSEFTYGPGDFVTSLTTPYGTTSFSFGASGLDRWLEATDPLGGTERLEYVNQTTEVPDPPPPLIPEGFPTYWEMGNGVTFYWDKRASALYPGDKTKANLTHWLRHDLATAAMGTDIIGAEKKPLENWVFYPGPGSGGGRFAGPNARPTRVGRVLDDPDGGGPAVGPSQIYIYAYNARGLKIKEVDPLGRETAYFYGTGTVVDPDQTTGTGIDLLQIKQKNGGAYELLVSYTYNTQHERLTSTDAAGKTTTYTYTAQGQLATVTTPPRAGIIENRTTTYEYFPDNAPLGPGRLQRVTGPASGATTTYTYDGYGRPRTVTDSEGYVLTTDYDALDRPTRVTYPDGTYDETVYNRLDAQDQRDRLGRWSHTFHDALSRPVSMRDPANRTTTQQWCTCASLDKVIDANGNATSWDRDVQGRVTKETRADANFHAFTYETTTSRLKTRTDPKLQVTTYTYFLDDNLSQTAYTNATIPTPTVSFAYDSVYNRPSSMTDGTGTTSYAYYPVTVPPALGAGRLQAVDGPLTHDTVSYSYDELGRITTRGLADFSTTSGYDVLGRLTPLGSPLGNFAWTYVNTTGRPQTVTYPNGQVTTYGYFNNVGDQRLQQIKHQQTAGGTVLSQFDYTYDPIGSISTWRQQLGISRQKLYALGYDAADQLTSAVQKDTSTLQILKNYGYAYDPAGNKTVDAQDSTATTSQYNNRNELTQQTGGGALPVAGTLNEPATVTVSGTPASVNVVNQFAGAAQVGTGTQTFTVVATDPSLNTRTNTYQVNVSGTAQTFVHDANGNLCAKGGTTCTNGTTTYDWDAENRLVAVKQGATTLASFVYDGTGRRAQKIAGGATRSYVYDRQNIIQERLSSGQTYDYVQGPGIDWPLAQRDQAGVVSYYLADHLGSIAQTTSSAGAVTLTRAYDPWGNLIQGASVGGYAFTGREWDAEVGLYYYRARYYDPNIGRFISEDPIGLDTGDPNFFAYVESNPINWTDPFGLQMGGPNCQIKAAPPTPRPSPTPPPCFTTSLCPCGTHEEFKWNLFWPCFFSGGNTPTVGTAGQGRNTPQTGMWGAAVLGGTPSAINPNAPNSGSAAAAAPAAAGAIADFCHKAATLCVKD